MGRPSNRGGSAAGIGAGRGIGGFLGSSTAASSSASAYGVPSTTSTTAATAPANALGEKSLLELSVASRVGSHARPPPGATTATTSRATTYEAEASAHRMFAREGYGFDSARLGRNAREFERRANVSAAASSSSSSSSAYPSPYALGGGFGRSGEEEKKEGTESHYEGRVGGEASHHHPLSDLTGSASLRVLLSNHHEHCVRTALRSAREWTVTQAQQRVDARIKGDWELERREILGRGIPGNRFLMGGGTAADGIGGGGGRGAGMGVERGVASRVPLLEGGTVATTTVAGSRSSPGSDVVPSPQRMPGNTEGWIKSHLTSVDEYLTKSSSSPQSTSSNAMKLLASLQDGVRDAAGHDPSPNPESASGYSNALSLLQSIINCSTSLGLDLSTPALNNDKHVAAATGVMGACHFFAKQFASHVAEVVREAELSGLHPTNPRNNALGSAAARDVCAYATIASGRDVVEGRGGVWPCLFYSLRCGDLVAANSILQQFGTTAGGENMSHIDPSVANLISQLAQLQQTQETIFGDSTNNNTRTVQPLAQSLLYPSQSMLQARRSVSDLYQRTKTRLQSTATDQEPFLHYRMACLAMIGGAESISEASELEPSGLVKTVEDYLYASLWHAIHLADDTAAPSVAIGGLGAGGGLRKVSESVARLSVLVNQWGPSYFEQDEPNTGRDSAAEAVAYSARGGSLGGAMHSHNKVPPSGGWAFALPLLASQQYATALAYLAEAGGGLGLLQSTHLGVVMDLVGLSIRDSTLDELPDAVSKELSQQTLLPMLVASYSASLQEVDAGAALKYLMLLSNKGKFVKEQVQRLLLETHQFETLAGTLQPDGSRSNGALDAYFSKKEVSALLVDAANHAIRVGKPNVAAELLVLSGRFGALFELMNRELASYLNASTPEDIGKRQFWFNAASQFHAIHLTGGRSYVQTTLDDEGNIGLGNTFQLLMNLVIFFDRCRDEQWEGACVLMDNLQIFPKTESEMTVKVEAFRALDNCVRRVFHHVVIAAMEALCHLFRTLKQSGGQGASAMNQLSTLDQSLNELRARARLLVTFARLLNLPSLGDSDTYVRISQLEKNMM